MAPRQCSRGSSGDSERRRHRLARQARVGLEHRLPLNAEIYGGGAPHYGGLVGEGRVSADAVHLLQVPLEVKAEELQPLPRVERTREDVRKDHGLQRLPLELDREIPEHGAQ